jgi:hypothetical protein
MRPTKEKAKQSDKGLDFKRIWEFLGEESPAAVPPRKRFPPSADGDEEDEHGARHDRSK